MKPELRRVGNSESPVVVVDDFSGNAEDVARLADGLAPFPQIDRNYYPGVRRVIGEADGPANDYVERTCRDAAQFIAGAFNIDSFDLTQASFSIVTVDPGNLQPAQRAPHFDSPDPAVLAMIHYLRVPEGSGTAFFRHRATGVERVTDENVQRFVGAAKADAARLLPDSGYISGSDEFFEQIGAVEGVPDRLVIYHGSLLHSGIIPKGMAFSADPREGRLTANYFLRGH